MKYIVKALRTTYHNERKAYKGLNDLIGMLDGREYEYEYNAEHIAGALQDINDLLRDIEKGGLQ